MKKITFLFVALLSINLSLYAQGDDLVKNFIDNPASIESTEVKRPIVKFAELAESSAAKSVVLTKENIEEVLTEAKSFKTLVIITGTHTIVKVTNLEDCVQSGSWGTCMPMGDGYVSRAGVLENLKGHINNIIGIPGSQSRTAYFFR